MLRHSLSLACFSTGIVVTGGAIAAEPAFAIAREERWHPGSRTASSVEGEVEPRDDSLSRDGVYGRFDGDLFVSLGAGVELGGGARAGGVGRALLFQTLGLALGYGQAVSDAAELERVAFVGLELRPLFLPRFAWNLEGAGALIDLTLDSLALGAGACFASESGESQAAVLEFSAGLGVPLLLTARGPWLEARAALRPALEADRGQMFLLLSWYESVETMLVR
jgi:hypothetical protein